MFRILQFMIFLIAIGSQGPAELSAQALEAKIFNQWVPELELTQEYLKSRDLKFDESRRLILKNLRFEFKNDKSFALNLKYPIDHGAKGTFRIDKVDEKNKLIKLTLKATEPVASTSIITLKFLKLKMRDVVVMGSSTDTPVVMIKKPKRIK